MRIIALLIAFVFIVVTTVPQSCAAATNNKKVATVKNKTGLIKRK